MTTRDEFDRQLRAMAHGAVQEMGATPRVERRVLTPKRRFPVAPLAVAIAAAAAIGIAIPLLNGHSLRGGTAGPTPNEATKSASVILQDMRTAMRSLHAYHMVERGTATDGTTPVLIDVRMDHIGSVAESISIGNQTDAVVLSHGTVFAKGPDVTPTDLQNVIGTHWFGVKDPSLADVTATLSTPDHMMECFTGAPGTLTTAGIHIIRGVRTVRVVSTETTPDTVSFTVDVAVDGPAYAIHYETDAGPSTRPGCSTGTYPQASQNGAPADVKPSHQTMDFDGFNTHDLIPTPNPLDVVDKNAAP